MQVGTSPARRQAGTPSCWRLLHFRRKGKSRTRGAMFDSPRLSGICGSDPRNLLTEAGRRRLEDAHWEADLIRKAALASLEFRYKSEADADVGFLEYLSTGQAYIDLKQADV